MSYAGDILLAGVLTAAPGPEACRVTSCVEHLRVRAAIWSVLRRVLFFSTLRCAEIGVEGWGSGGQKEDLDVALDGVARFIKGAHALCVRWRALVALSILCLIIP